jgi:hypothetical protein
LIEVLRAAADEGFGEVPTLATIGEEEEDWEEFDSDEKAEHPVDFEPNEVTQQREACNDEEKEEEDEDEEDESEEVSEGEGAGEDDAAGVTKPGVTRAKPPRRPPAKTRGKKAKRDRPPTTRALAFVFSLIAFGMNSRQTEDFVYCCNGEPPRQCELRRALGRVCDAIIAEARRCCEVWLSMIPPGTVVAYDGSWGHRRNSDQCFGAFIALTPDPNHPANGKVIDFDFVQRRFGLQQSGNYAGSSQAMESAVLRKMVQRLKVNQPNIVGFAHDQDAKAWTVIRDEGWNLVEYKDPNHVFKSVFERAFRDWNVAEVAMATKRKPRGRAPAKRGRKRALLKGLKEGLRKHLRYCAMSYFPDDAARVRAWKGAYEYYIDPKHGWALRDDELAREHLKGFLEATADLVVDVKSRINTQASESLNALKAKQANKNYNFTRSWFARMAVAVLRMNEGFSWIAGLRAAVVGEPLGPIAVEHFRQREKSRQEHNASGKTPEGRTARYVSRAKTAKRRKAETAQGRQDAEHAPSRDRKQPRPTKTAAAKRTAASADSDSESSASEPQAADVVLEVMGDGVDSPPIPVQVRASVPPAPVVWDDREGRELDVRPSLGAVRLADRPGLLEGGLANQDQQTCHLNAVLEVFFNFAPIRAALQLCGFHPLVYHLRLMADKRKGVADCDFLKEILEKAAPKIWNGWFRRMRDPAETFEKLVMTLDGLPDDVGKPVSSLFAGTWKLQRRCPRCGAALGEPVGSSGSTIRFVTTSHDDRAYSESSDAWVNAFRRGSFSTCPDDRCRATSESVWTLTLDVPPAILVFNVDGQAAKVVDLPDQLDLGTRYHFGACVLWSGTAHVIARVRDNHWRVGFTNWREYDDSIVRDLVSGSFVLSPAAPHQPGEGHRPGDNSLRIAPFKLAFFCQVSEPLDSSQRTWPDGAGMWNHRAW